MAQPEDECQAAIQRKSLRNVMPCVGEKTDLFRLIHAKRPDKSTDVS